MFEVEFRAAVPSDFGPIRELLAASGWAVRVADADRFRTMMENADRKMVATYGDRVVGFARDLRWSFERLYRHGRGCGGQKELRDRSWTGDSTNGRRSINNMGTQGWPRKRGLLAEIGFPALWRRDGADEDVLINSLQNHLRRSSDTKWN